MSSLSSSQCSIDAPCGISGGRDFVFVKRNSGQVGLALYHSPEAGNGEPTVLWETFDLPPALKKEMGAKYELVKSLPAEPLQQLEYLTKVGSELGYHELCFGVAYTPTTVVWTSSSGLLILERQTGKQIQYIETFVSANRYWADEATASINSGDNHFVLPTKRGGSFFADCHREKDQLLVYFSGVELIILTAPASTGLPAINHRISWDPEVHKVPSKPGKSNATFVTKDKIEISLEGVVFL